MYDLFIMCALRRFFPIINVCRDPPRGIITVTARATALENAVAYVRWTMYDIRFIHNVRVAQILRIMNGLLLLSTSSQFECHLCIIIFQIFAYIFFLSLCGDKEGRSGDKIIRKHVNMFALVVGKRMRHLASFFHRMILLMVHESSSSLIIIQIVPFPLFDQH